MKTSYNQQEMMVTFMQQHGDLSKPRKEASGRLKTIQLWDELTTLLNSDATGDQKTIDKWKKVWSDLKNNTKKKQARLHRAAFGTGGGPAVTSRLSDLEQRVLNIMGELAATGLNTVSEAGFSENTIEVMPEATAEDTGTSWDEREPRIVIEVQEDVQEWNRAGGSHQPHIPPPASPTPALVEDLAPATEGHTPRRTSPRRRGTSRRSPRRRLQTRTTAFQEASQHFLHSDEEWRKFLMESHHDKDKNEKERLRLRGIELELQQQWQQIYHRMLDALHKLIDSRLVEKD